MFLGCFLFGLAGFFELRSHTAWQFDIQFLLLLCKQSHSFVEGVDLILYLFEFLVISLSRIFFLDFGLVADTALGTLIFSPLQLLLLFLLLIDP